MRVRKWFKPIFCKCDNNVNLQLPWWHVQYEITLVYFNCMLIRGIAVAYFLITVRPLFFMSIGPWSSLLQPCNGTETLSFNKFEKLISEYKALKRVIVNIQASKNINAISHYYESYRTPRNKVFEELLLLWEQLDELYQKQKQKYLECYLRNRNSEYASLNLHKWVISSYLIILSFFLISNLHIFSQYKVILPKVTYQKLIQKWKKYKLQIFILSISAFVPLWYLPEFIYFLDYWFFIDGYYLGL